MLRAQSLECIRDDRCLFRDLDFTLAPGQVISVEGRNGSGKTSLLRILCGIRLADAGAVYWQDTEIGRLGPGYFLHVAYIGHADGIKLDLTPRENLLFAAALGSRRNDADVDAVLDRVGLYALEEVPTRVLSAGQKRRLALARLLATSAALWVLDEPLSSLDRAGIDLFEALLSEHLAEGGLAVMTTHHRLALDGAAVQRMELSAP
jgi:heme exporter protein A